jgi:hypothetical protein
MLYLIKLYSNIKLFIIINIINIYSILSY